LHLEITIREATPEDARGIDAILRSLGWFERINKETAAYTQAQIMQSLVQCQREGSHTILVAELVDGTVAGYSAIHWFPTFLRGDEGYVSELFVYPSLSDRGIGSLLLDTVKEHALKRGCIRLILMNRRDRESYRRGFYAAHGWEELREGALFTLTLPRSA